MLANRWNSSFPVNFNVKGMLQASGSMGVVVLGWSTGHCACVCVCANVCLYACISGGKGK